MLKTKRFNKVIALALMFCLMAVSVVGFTPIKAKATTPEVQLYFGELETGYYYINGSATQLYWIDGFVSVNTGGSNKAVTCHYSLNNGTWQDVSATYVRTDPSNYEVWHFETAKITRGDGLNYYFALRYDVDGSFYWDNNGGNNYNLWVQAGNPQSVCHVLSKSALMKDYDAAGGTTFSGSIILKNLAYDKMVKVRYTTDNWLTYTDLDASYCLGVDNGLERWNFSTSITLGATVKYAIYYTANGITYWDNNFGINYTVS